MIEITPREIKNSLTGYGDADKQQMNTAIKEVLHVTTIRSMHASDALAVALTAFYRQASGEDQMISYLKGFLRINRANDDKITLIVNGIGYDVLIPSYEMKRIKGSKADGDELELYVSYNQTERQPKPMLVGFQSPLDKKFFELFISVEDIGPIAAVRALVKPAREIARSIEDKDVKALRQLKGIGERKAEKIVATLKGKVAKYALMPEVEITPAVAEDFRKEVETVLVTQLGHKHLEARQMIEDAIKQNPLISSSEGLFEEVYRGQKQ